MRRIRRNRKAVITMMHYLAVIILALMVAFIYLLASGAIGRMIEGFSKEQICVLSAYTEHYTTIPVAGVKVARYKCEISRVEVDKKDLVLTGKEKSLEREYKSNPEYLEKAKQNPGQLLLNKIMGQQLRSCWERIGRGKLDLFPNWWLPLGFESEPKTWTDYVTKLGIEQTPVFCVICARVKFDEDVAKIFPGGSGDTLNEYLKNTPHPNPYEVKADGARKSLYEFLEDEDSKDKVDFPRNYVYSTDQPQAVVFGRMNVFQGRKPFSWFGAKVGLINEEDRSQPVDTLFIAPYANLADYCTQLANE